MNKKATARKCVGCLGMFEKKDLIRVIKDAQGEIKLDTTGKMNGRGAYLCPQEECLKKARKNHGIERSFKMQIPGAIYDELEHQLQEENHAE